MAVIIGTEVIKLIQDALTEMKERVERGGILSKDEAQLLARLEEVGLNVSKIRGNDTRNTVLSGANLLTVTDKWRLPEASGGDVAVKHKLPECYNSRVCFQPKGEDKKYLKHFGQAGEGNSMVEYTTNVEEAKLFRSHVGWMGPGPDFDCYHVAMSFLRTLFTMDGAYRTALGGEALEMPDNSVDFITESLDGRPRLTYVLIKTEG